MGDCSRNPVDSQTRRGGAGTLIGLAVDAVIFLVLKNVVNSYSEHWLAVIGITFVCCVIFFPGGIWPVAQAGVLRVHK
jgi:ABC-type branched-subunit amino acid transport system permease subunit